MKENNIALAGTVRALLSEKKYQSVRDALLTVRAVDIASVLGELPPQDVLPIFRILPKDKAAKTFVEMTAEGQQTLIRGFSDRELGEVLDELYLDDAVDLVEEMPSSLVKRILAKASPETRRGINELLKYPSDCAGSIMTTEYVELRSDLTAEEAIGRIRLTGVDRETVNVCYVTDSERRLMGEVSLRALILAAPDAAVGGIMTENVISVRTLEDREEVAHIFTRYGSIVLPVVDSEQRLVGIVTVDDVMDVIRDEATEDIDKMGAVTPSGKPYLKLSVLEIFKSRIPWLLLLMISAAFTGSIITNFEDALSALPVLVASIPMLMDTGGNCGSQASVTVIRGISLREIKFSDIFRVMWKEARVALLCGVTLAALNFLKLMFLSRVGVAVAAVVCLTLVITVLAAKLIGCSLPLLARRLGLDPAVMASPFITTVVDSISLFIYFKTAEAILGV